MVQAATDAGKSDALVYFMFDLVYLDGEAVSEAPLQHRKERLKGLLANVRPPLQYSDRHVGRGPEFARRRTIVGPMLLFVGLSRWSTPF
jgi:bifunctional non-homologous end joining protein LigD